MTIASACSIDDVTFQRHHGSQLTQRPCRRRVADGRKQECRAGRLDLTSTAPSEAHLLSSRSRRGSPSASARSESRATSARARTADPAVQLADPRS